MAAVLAIAGVAVSGGTPPRPAAAVVLPAGLRDGDLVFRNGGDLASRIVLAQREGAHWSHVGVVVLQQGVPWVVHAVPPEPGQPGGVLLQPLAEFAAPAHAQAVAYRRTALDAAGRAALRRHALAQLGKPFDDAFVSSDKSRLFCTELALDALAAAGVRPDIPRVRVPLHDEPIPTPEDLARWPGLAPLP